jgi:hypothetical protein
MMPEDVSGQSVPKPSKTARERCYDEIVSGVKVGMARYYSEYPERLADERSNEAVAWSTRGIQRVLLILDKYAIEDLPNPAQEPAPPNSRRSR